MSLTSQTTPDVRGAMEQPRDTLPVLIQSECES